MFHKIPLRLTMSALIASLLFGQLLSASAQAVSNEIPERGPTIYLPLVSGESQSGQFTEASPPAPGEAMPVENEATTVTAATTSPTLTVSARLGIGTDTPSASLHIANESGAPPSTLTSEQNGLLMGVQLRSGYKWIQSYGGGLAINPLAGNVGIGTTNPQACLDVNGSFRVANGGCSMNGGATAIIITGCNMGFGTTTPQRGLDVNGGLRVTNGSSIVDVGASGIIITGGKVGVGTTTPQRSLDVNGDFRVSNGSSLVDVGASGIIITGGNVGVGTTSPQSRLHVDGDLRVTNGRILVNGTTMNVPDYVFEADYPLLSLDEVRAYLAAEKHLPNVPSAKTIQQGDLDMSEFQLKLLEKIEELTLYTLAQDEQLKAQQTQIESLQQQNADFEARLAALEQQ